MEADRRQFLRLAASFAAGLTTGAAGEVEAPDALAVHRATRNTRLGAVRGQIGRWLGSEAPSASSRSGARLALEMPSRSTGLALADAVRGYAATRAFRAHPLPLSDLAWLLFLGNGPTGRGPRAPRRHGHRAAPSAGALYAGELYVVAQRVAGLPPGVYRYAAPEHALLRLQDGARFGEVEQAVERPASVADAAVALLLTNVFGRYGQRYGDRGYRYAILDSGHIGENLRLAAVAASLGESAPLRFEDERLNGLLGVDGRAEAVCALHAVGHRSATAPARPHPARRLRERAWASDRPASVPERYHQASALQPGGSARASPAPAGPGRPEPGVPLPLLEPAPRTRVQQTIERRCSARRFADRALAPQELGFVLEMAAGHPALVRAPGVDVLVVVNRVHGLRPGLYRYGTGSGLHPQRLADLGERLADACLGQQRAATAAAACLLVGRLAEARGRAGERSYRDLLLEAGAIAERIHLAAAAARLRARNLAAFWDDELNDLAGLDGRSRAVVHLTLVGA